MLKVIVAHRLWVLPDSHGKLTTWLINSIMALWRRDTTTVGNLLNNGSNRQKQHALFKWVLAGTLIISGVVANTIITPNALAFPKASIPITSSPTQQWHAMYSVMATQLAGMGRLLAARPLLERSLELNPDDLEGHLVTIMVLEGLGDKQAALAMIDNAIALAPDNGELYYKKGMIESALNRPEKAMAALEKAAALAPDEPVVFYDLGVLYSNAGNYTKAIETTRVATNLDPNFAEAWNNLAYALGNLGRYAEALTTVDKALKANPDNAAAIDTKAFALQGLKQYDEALALYNRAIVINPNIPEVYLHKAQTLDALNRLPEALITYREYAGLVGDVDTDTQERMAQLDVLVGEDVDILEADDDADLAHPAAGLLWQKDFLSPLLTQPSETTSSSTRQWLISPSSTSDNN